MRYPKNVCRAGKLGPRYQDELCESWDSSGICGRVKEACKEMPDNIAKRVRHSILILGDGRGHSIPLFFCTIYCQG